MHGAYVDNQCATGSIIPDVIQLQTLQDFTRRKAEDRLLPSKHEGHEHVRDLFKDPDGAWLLVGLLAFSYM
ncbi:iron(III) transport system substrate-binding protein (plasmid) [Ketogulonicigenium robustum]|uniref:Iron(III) transport system substrate-binding protein n=1 Tax=Ketogulonicigenium robustum TaxID=92947 RepID=A0A1W6P2X0_9RHOB|nr:hypothetical protein [Ketogulonicigenium robustum]ARO15855.1 iron(III) transport system substrate-binding protein [Ketogulonicigenium robustum]